MFTVLTFALYGEEAASGNSPRVTSGTAGVSVFRYAIEMPPSTATVCPVI